MAISALVLTLSEVESLAREALRCLAEDPRLTLGEGAAGRVAAVLETPSEEDDRSAFGWMKGIRGVVRIEIAAVFYEATMRPEQRRGRADRAQARVVAEGGS